MIAAYPLGLYGFQRERMDWTFQLFFDNIMNHSVGLDPREVCKERACYADSEVGFPFGARVLVTYVKV